MVISMVGIWFWGKGLKKSWKSGGRSFFTPWGGDYAKTMGELDIDNTFPDQ